MAKMVKNTNSNSFEALHQIAAERGIPREDIEEIVESAMLSAYKKQYGSNENVKVLFNRDTNAIIVQSRKMVVNKPVNLAEEVAISAVSKSHPKAQLGDIITVEENPLVSFGLDRPSRGQADQKRVSIVGRWQNVQAGEF